MSSWGNGGGLALPVDSLVDAPSPRKKPRPGVWKRAEIATAAAQLAGLEPFRCTEGKDHAENQRKAAAAGASRMPLIRWFPIVSFAQRGAEWPECCGQVMELVPSDEAQKLRDRVAKNRKLTTAEIAANEIESENAAEQESAEPQ